jgi:hypothetical protein
MYFAPETSKDRTRSPTDCRSMTHWQAGVDLGNEHLYYTYIFSTRHGLYGHVLEATPTGAPRLMCRSIKPLFNFEPPATEDEVRAASLQFVRKLSGMNNPSGANQPAFDRAVDDIARVAAELLASLQTTASPKNREIEAERARARSASRFDRPSA